MTYLSFVHHSWKSVAAVKVFTTMGKSGESLIVRRPFVHGDKCLYSLYTSASYKLNLCIYAMLRVPSTT